MKKFEERLLLSSWISTPTFAKSTISKIIVPEDLNQHICQNINSHEICQLEFRDSPFKEDCHLFCVPNY
jgi:hypothetical protein